MPDRLPVLDLEGAIVEGLRGKRRLVLSAPTGSGKSTQVPQLMLRRGLPERGQIVILQPRRIAARLLAARVAHEMGVPLGREVGYQVRFEGASSAATRLLYVTEGVLLRRLLREPSLPGVGAILFDEFHERHLDGDLSLARALDVQESTRPDLLVGVMSATLDVEGLAAYLAPAATVSSEGRTFPVKVEYAPGDEDRPWEAAADAAERAEGDVLVFMPGGYEIGRTMDALRSRPALSGSLILPLHGELTPEQQDAAVARYDRRKIVVATNVAETSLTIDGVRTVIDSGLARIPRHDPRRGLNTLLVEKISRASADQRAGRAGRTGPGVAIRLWPEREHARRPARELPEVKRLELSEAALSLKAAGVGDLARFRWLEPPEPASLAHALGLLAELGALDAEERITAIGRRMAAFPLPPRLSRMLLAAHEHGCVPRASLAAALLSGRDLLRRGADADDRQDRIGRDDGSDLDRLRKAWEYAASRRYDPEACRRAGVHASSARQVGLAADQILRLAEREGLTIDVQREGDLRPCLLAGFPDRVARRLDAGTLRCEMVHGRRGLLARESAARSGDLFVAAEVREVETRNGVDTIFSLCSPVEPAWLPTTRALKVEYDPGPRRVVADEELRYRDLAIETRRLDRPPAEEAARLLALEVGAGRLRLPGWDDAVESWIRRVNLVARSCPELAIPGIGDADRISIVEQLCDGAVSAKELGERKVLPVVRAWLSGPQQALVEKHAPERLELPNGRKPKVDYAPDGTVAIEARIQDLYGVQRAPRIAMGRVGLLVRILAPSQRPVQVTADLEGFWRDTYPTLKKELQRRYPKHEWR